MSAILWAVLFLTMSVMVCRRLSKPMPAPLTEEEVRRKLEQVCLRLNVERKMQWIGNKMVTAEPEKVRVSAPEAGWPHLIYPEQKGPETLRDIEKISAQT